MTRRRRLITADPGARPPVYPWRAAPPHLATRAQLAIMGLRPGRQDVQGLLLWPSRRSGRPRIEGYRFARLYDTRLARPRIAMTERRAAALAAATAARKTCRVCGINRGYVPSTRLGACNQCAAAPGFAA